MAHEDEGRLKDDDDGLLALWRKMGVTTEKAGLILMFLMPKKVVSIREVLYSLVENYTGHSFLVKTNHIDLLSSVKKPGKFMIFPDYF